MYKEEKSKFLDLTENELELFDGGIFGSSVGVLISGTLSGAAVGTTIGGPVGFVAGAIVGAGVTYLYDHV